MWTITGWYDDARRRGAADPNFYRQHAEFCLAAYQRELPGVTRAEIVQRLAASNRARLDAVPDLRTYPELRGMRELVDAEWRGVRDGAGLTDEQWAASCDGNFYMHRCLLRRSAHQAARCSYMFFPDSDHGPLLANNLDSSPGEPFGPPTWPMANEHLLLGGVSSGVFLDEESPERFPAPVSRLVARYCRTTAEAVELLRRYNHFWGPCNLLIVDRGCQTAMVEKSACRIGVRHSADGFGLITAMTAEEPGMHAWLEDRRQTSLVDRGLAAPCADTAYWGESDARRQLMNELLGKARQAPTLAALERAIRYRDPARACVCYDGDEFWPGMRHHTLRTSIWRLREGLAHWWAWAPGQSVLTNRQPDVTFKDELLWD